DFIATPRQPTALAAIVDKPRRATGERRQKAPECAPVTHSLLHTGELSTKHSTGRNASGDRTQRAGEAVRSPVRAPGRSRSGGRPLGPGGAGVDVTSGSQPASSRAIRPGQDGPP